VDWRRDFVVVLIDRYLIESQATLVATKRKDLRLVRRRPTTKRICHFQLAFHRADVSNDSDTTKSK
jgi:hypothetical protein